MAASPRPTRGHTNLAGPSMTIAESQLEVIAWSFETKYGCFSAANSRSR